MTAIENLTAVADASFVIGVSVCGQWETLEALVKTLIIADAVWEEVVEQGEGKPGQKELQQATFVERRSISNINAGVMLTATLDKGEAQPLVLATELGVTTVFMDDLRGRKIAQSVGLQTIGVAGFLLLAKNKKRIQEVRPFLLQLHQKGFRLSGKLVNEILKTAGEELI